MVDYSSVFLIFVLSVIICLVLVVLSLVVAVQELDTENVSAYECGFDPFNDASQPFQVSFFLVGILFIIFDLEISFLFPWSLVLGEIVELGFWSMFVFLVILTFGLFYEWVKGGLEWN